MTLQVQLFTTMMMLGCGILLGAVYDACRVTVVDFRLPKWTYSVIDALYWIFATIFVFQVLRYSNDAEVRSFVFIGLALGAVAYYALLSSVVMRGIQQCLQLIKWLYRLVVMLINIFVFQPLLLGYRIILWMFGIISTLTILLFKGILKLLYPLRILGTFLSKFLLIHKRMQPIWNKIKNKFSRNHKGE